MKRFLCFLLTVVSVASSTVTGAAAFGVEADAASSTSDGENDHIKWIDFTPCRAALSDALDADIDSHDTKNPVSWVEILAYLASRNGGNFSSYKSSDTKAILSLISDGSDIGSHVKNQKLYSYYLEAYGAVLGGMVGEYEKVTVTDGTECGVAGYGLRVFSPIGKGFYYTDYDDFGASRSYGYRRRHLGHDMMGSVGTPIVAVESGYIEALGWNQYGGWRVGIRSFDGKRYYYYAHLRRDHPYADDIYEGKIVNAGEVIGYLGMTGYSAKENVNNIDTPHLHFGLQIIFVPEQKEGVNQIWVDLYGLCGFLSEHRSPVGRDGKEYRSTTYLRYPETPD